MQSQRTGQTVHSVRTSSKTPSTIRCQYALMALIGLCVTVHLMTLPCPHVHYGVLPWKYPSLDEFESIWLKRETLKEAQQNSSLSYIDSDKHVDRGYYLYRANLEGWKHITQREVWGYHPRNFICVYIESAVHIKSMKKTIPQKLHLILPRKNGTAIVTRSNFEEIDNLTFIHCFENFTSNYLHIIHQSRAVYSGLPYSGEILWKTIYNIVQNWRFCC